MGRNRNTAERCEQSQRIELSYLLKKGHLKKGQINPFTLYWTDGHGQKIGSISVICNWANYERHIELKYTLTGRDGKEYKYNYKIRLTTVPSNLGKGEVLYFVCPVSGNRCRVLYRAFGSHKWHARNAYDYRLYYTSQLSSKSNYLHDRYFALDRQIKRLQPKKYFKHTYNGKPTKAAQRLQRLRSKQIRFNFKRLGVSMFF